MNKFLVFAGKKSNKSRTVVTIVVPVLVPLLVVLVALMICMTYIKYSRARKLREKPDSKYNEIISLFL